MRSRPAFQELLPRLMITVGVAMIVFVVALWKWAPILHWLGQPAGHFVTQTHGGTYVMDSRPLQLDIAVNVTVLATVVLLAYALVAAAFTDRWRGRLLGLVSGALLAAGGVFGWYVLVPQVLDQVYEGRTISIINPFEYLELVSLTVLGTGILFQLPCVYLIGRARAWPARWIVYSWGGATAILVAARLLLENRGGAGDSAVLYTEVAAIVIVCAIAWALTRGRPREEPAQV
jgi:Sec-independent protein secretion pathway component TatC